MRVQSPHKNTSIPKIIPKPSPSTRPSANPTTLDHRPPRSPGKLFAQTNNTNKYRQHGSRERLVLAPQELRQGLAQLVRIFYPALVPTGEIAASALDGLLKIRIGKRRDFGREGNTMAMGARIFPVGMGSESRNQDRTLTRTQPCLQAQGRSHPEVRPGPLPSVLQGEGQGHWLQQGMASTAPTILDEPNSRI